MSDDLRTYQIRTGAAPGDDCIGYDVTTAQQVMDGLDPGSVSTAAGVYDSVATAYGALATTLADAANRLSQHWGGSAASGALERLGQLHATAVEITRRSQETSTALQNHAAQIRQFAAMKFPATPGLSFAQSAAVQSLAQTAVQSLNHQIGITWQGMPPQIQRNLPRIGQKDGPVATRPGSGTGNPPGPYPPGPHSPEGNPGNAGNHVTPPSPGSPDPRRGGPGAIPSPPGSHRSHLANVPPGHAPASPPGTAPSMPPPGPGTPPRLPVTPVPPVVDPGFIAPARPNGPGSSETAPRIRIPAEARPGAQIPRNAAEPEAIGAGPANPEGAIVAAEAGEAPAGAGAGDEALGAPIMGGPGAPAEESARERTTWLTEERRIWAGEDAVSPAVIGGGPNRLAEKRAKAAADVAKPDEVQALLDAMQQPGDLGLDV